MSTQIITLQDGIRIEAEVTDTMVAYEEGVAKQTIDSIKPLLLRVVAPIRATWDELSEHVERAEIEIGFGIETSGNFFVASTKGSINLKVKLVIARSPAGG